MTREEIKNKVVEIIANKTYFRQSEIKESTSFKSDIGTDSLDNFELLIEFEREFGIKIPDEEMLTVYTVGEAIDGICQKLGVSICKKQQPEVDFEKEIDTFFDKWDKNGYGCIFDENGARVTIETIKRVVKHFLNARKEESK